MGVMEHWEKQYARSLVVIGSHNPRGGESLSSDWSLGNGLYGWAGSSPGEAPQPPADGHHPAHLQRHLRPHLLHGREPGVPHQGKLSATMASCTSTTNTGTGQVSSVLNLSQEGQLVYSSGKDTNTYTNIYKDMRQNDLTKYNQHNKIPRFVDEILFHLNSLKNRALKCYL